MAEHRLWKRYRVVAATVAAALLVWLYTALSAWTDKTTIFVLAFGLLFALLLLLDWVLDLFVPEAWRLIRSVGVGMGRAVAHDPEVVALLDRHPRFGGWIRRRLTLSTWSGWYLTATVLVALWFLYGFVSIARDLATTSSIVAYDPGIAALVRVYRTPVVTRVLWTATVFGDGRVHTIVAVAVVALLLMWGRRAEALLFAITVPFTSAVSGLVKVAAARARPPAAFMLIHRPGDASFPSGHALSSLVFFGLLAFILCHDGPARTVRQRLVVLTLAATAAFTVALSRVYLGVHWPSDVAASWFLGGAILTVAIGTFLMWERYGTGWQPVPPLWTQPVRRVVTGGVAVVVVAAVVVGAQADPLLAAVTTPHVVRRYSSTDLRTFERSLPRFTEKLNGSPQEPVSLVFVGPEAELKAAFTMAGWQLADPPNLVGVLHAYVSAAADQPYPTAPMTPSFIGGQANDLGFEKPEGRATARRRHHARFWLTDLTLDGKPVWVGTASFDSGVGFGALGIPTHRIAPDIDTERALVAAALAKTGLARREITWDAVPPEAGTNANGDRFYTDGRAVGMFGR